MIGAVFISLARFKIGVLVLGLSISFEAFAVEQELSLNDILNLTVTSVSKNEENYLKAPATMQVITEADIRSRGYSDLEQVFHDLPGFSISMSHGMEYSSLYLRGYRSNNTDRLLLLVNGVEDNDLWKGNIWLSRQYPLSNIKRIEVVYGPASTMYGANAFAGVVNIITKEPSDIVKEGNIWGISSQAGYGTWKTRYADVTLAAKTRKVQFTLTGKVFASDEMDLSKYPDYDYNIDHLDLDFYKSVLGAGTTDAQAQKAKDQDALYYYAGVAGKKPGYYNNSNDFFLQARVKLGESFEFGAMGWRKYEGIGANYRDDFRLNQGDSGKWIPEHFFVYAKYEEKLLEGLTLSNQATYKIHDENGHSHSQNFYGFFNRRLSKSKLNTTNPYWKANYSYVYSNQFRDELKAVYDFSSKLQLVSGFEVRLNHIQGDYVKSGDSNVSETGLPNDQTATDPRGGNFFSARDLGLFAQLGFAPVEELKLTLGSRVDNNRIRDTGGYGTVYNPRVAVVYSPSSYIFKMIYSEAFKDADYWSKMATSTTREFNNPNLPPEKVHNLELSAGKELTKNILVDLAAYQANYSNVLGTVSVPSVKNPGTMTTQNQPVGALRIRGIQARSVFKAQNYSAYMNYSYTHPWNIGQGKRVGDIPSHTVNVGGNVIFLSHLDLGLRMNFVGARRVGPSTTSVLNPYDVIPSYTVLNGALTYETPLKGLDAQLAVNNIFNREYFDPGLRDADGVTYAARLPQNDRNFMIKARYNF